MNIKLAGGLLAGLGGGSMAPAVEARLLAENDARMRRLYPGSLYDDLILLQRRGYVVVWHRHPKTLSVDGRQLTVRAFKSLAARERRLASAPVETPAPQTQSTKDKPMSMTSPYYYETADALDTPWTTAEEAEAVLCLIGAALEVEDDPYWLDELQERREAALAALPEINDAEPCFAHVDETAAQSAASNPAEAAR